MNLGIDASRAVLSRRTGTEEYSLHLIRHLLQAATGQPGVTFRLYSPQPPAAGLFPPDAPAQWRVMPFPRLWTHLRLAAEILARPPDALFVPAHVLPLTAGARSVVTIHDLGYHYFPEAHSRTRLAELELTTRWNAWRAAHVIADSRATRDDLVRFYGAAEEKISVVYPGLRPGLQPVTGIDQLRAVQERLHIPGPYFLYVGTLQPRKNLVRLVQAYAAFRATVREPAGQGERLGTGGEPDLPVLVLAGRAGWHSEPIARQVQELGLEQSVLFPGYVDEADLPALLSGAAGLVFPSLYEGFGFPVLEAMACGTPVITSTTSSLPEVAGDAALLVRPDDVAALAGAMNRLWSEPGLRRELVQRGLRQAASFEWDRAARQVLQILLAVASGRRVAATASQAG